MREATEVPEFEHIKHKDAEEKLTKAPDVEDERPEEEPVRTPEEIIASYANCTAIYIFACLPRHHNAQPRRRHYIKLYRIIIKVALKFVLVYNLQLT